MSLSITPNSYKKGLFTVNTTTNNKKSAITSCSIANRVSFHLKVQKEIELAMEKKVYIHYTLNNLRHT